MIYNAKKEFWHPAARTFQTDPFEIDDGSWTMEYPMAARSDDTVDAIHYEDGSMSVALDRIEKTVVDEAVISLLREMNRECLSEGLC